MKQQKQTGVVKAWKSTYGFLKADDGSPDLFVHFSDIEGMGQRDLVVGQRVSFVAAEGERGPKAVGVEVIE